ncbi:MAG: hypothetical protein IJ617_10205 [Oscillospiraceae bacterium]|nr:hypothetical protein [Oscillospiraceae bacterium]
MLLIRNLRLAPGEPEAALKAQASRSLGVPARDIIDLQILRRSLDARKKRDIHWEYAVALSLPGEEALLRRGAAPYEPFRYELPRVRSDTRPVVAGFGPAGMFAALALAEAGLRPIVLERGGDAASRQEAVKRFWEGGGLDPECNVQFGEGGAGAFSDGKLATNTHDRRNGWVLRRFRDFGAPGHVVYDARPHVGTDLLVKVVQNLRRHIEGLGAEVRFHCRFTGFTTDGLGALRAVEALGPEGPFTLPCRALILAPGHSARDTFEYLLSRGVAMEPKPFSMGVRVEHRQIDVDLAQYGRPRGKYLPPAEYRGSVRLPNGGSAYTFCMCPGGYVVAASSEAGGIVTNGMSYSGRAGENANAALLAALRPADVPADYTGPLAGMYWQREIERKCWRYAGGNDSAPAQTVGDFLAGRAGAGPGSVVPSCRPGVFWGDLRRVLPGQVTDTLAAAIPRLASSLRFFAEPGAVLTAPETRSSSPVRVCRGADLQALPGLYPCGEGAGWAGGITSAAVDGLRCAEAVIAAIGR